MIPSHVDIQYFLAIAETGNLSRAAEKLGVVQPTLSQALKRLEQAIGKPLFTRQQVGVVLTAAGEVFQQSCQQLLGQWQELLHEVSQLEHIPSGRFRLGCHPSVAIYALPQFINRILQQPGIRLQLEHALSREVTEKIVSRQLDFGLVINPVKQNDLVLKKLCTDQMRFFKTDQAPDDVLIFNPKLSQSQHLLRKIGKRHEFQRQLTSDNLEVIAALAAQHTGLAILPERVAQTHRGLKPYRDFAHTDELYLVYHVDQSRTAGFRWIVDAITQAEI